MSYWLSIADGALPQAGMDAGLWPSFASLHHFRPPFQRTNPAAANIFSTSA